MMARHPFHGTVPGVDARDLPPQVVAQMRRALDIEAQAVARRADDDEAQVDALARLAEWTATGWRR